MAEKHWFLKRCQLFERLSAAELAQLESQSRCRRFDAGAVVYLPADQADAVLALTQGRVKICHPTPDGKETILAFIEPGEIFGEMCLFSTTDREELAIAVEASTIVLIPRDVLQSLVDRHAELALSVTRLVGFRRQRIERRLKHLLFHAHRERLIHLLLELAETYGVKQNSDIEIRIKLSHQDLAGLIGSTRESVSTTLGELQAAGLVRLGRGKLTITGRKALAEELRRVKHE